MAAPNRHLLIVPGAQKSGTTSLYGLLLQHEAIHSLTPPPGARWDENWKEPHFFALRKEIVRANLDWYRSLFGDESGWYVDASTSYLTAPRVPELVQDFSWDARYLAVLRDPVERALSAHRHMRREEPPVDRRSFDEIIDFVWRHREEGLVAAETEGLRRAVDSDQIDLGFLQSTYLADLPASSLSDLQDPLHLFRYLQQGLYSRQLRPYRSADAPLLLVCMEELATDPSATEALFSFLDLAPQNQTLPHLNRGSSPAAWRQRVRSLARRIPVLSAVVEWIGSESSRSSSYEVTDRTISRTRRLLGDEYDYWSAHRPAMMEYWQHTRL